MVVFLAGVAAAQAAPGAGDTIGTGAAGAGAEAGVSGGHLTGKRKRHTAEAQAAPGPAQPRGMVGGAGGPGGATTAGRAGDTAGVAGPRGATTEGGGSAGGGLGLLR